MARKVKAKTRSANETLDELVVQILKNNLEKLKASESLISNTSNANAEAIHDMRVAIRRIRAALKIFGKLLPKKAKKIRAALKKIFLLLGKKRDLDVFMQFLLQTVKFKLHTIPKLIRKIDKLQERILLKLQSKSYRKLLESLEKLKISKTKKNTLKEAEKRIRKALKKMLEMAPTINPKTDDVSLHKLRITLKILRYTCEFFDPAFKKNVCSLNSLIDKTKKLQDILGAHQDSITGIAMLNQYKNEFSIEEFLKIQSSFELKKKKARISFFKHWKDYWFGVGFSSTHPKTAFEKYLRETKG